MLFKCLVFLFCIFLSSISYGWSAPAHKIIATIAYQRLNPQAKKAVDDLTQVMFRSRSAYHRFLMAAIWPDVIRYDRVHTYDNWHFINYPYSIDGTPGRPINPENVAWAVQQSLQVLTNPKENTEKKALYLNFLLHFAGDAHQPLHCITLYSRDFPHGDAGGNLFFIRLPGFYMHVSRNNQISLHQFWDAAGELFRHGRHRLRNSQIKEAAEQITQRYPESYFGEQATNQNPVVWTQESYDLAKNAAYNITAGAAPDENYVKMVQTSSQKQWALAGYRLAKMLNTIWQ